MLKCGAENKAGAVRTGSAEPLGKKRALEKLRSETMGGETHGVRESEGKSDRGLEESKQLDLLKGSG